LPRAHAPEILAAVPERDAQELTAEPAAAAPVAEPPVVAPVLAPAPALLRTLQTRVGNAIVARAFEDEAEELDGGGKDAPKGDPTKTPTFDHSGGATETINADSAIDFSNKIRAKIGSPHTSPELTPDIQTTTTTRADGTEVPGSTRITSIDLKVKTSITKVRFGMGRVDAENKAIIDQMVQEIIAHEARHRAIAEAAAAKALVEAQKLVGTGKTTAATTALTKTLECAMNKEHEALDAKEGLLTVVETRQADGTIKLSLTKTASGAKYPCT
jgi:hypothetical protein